MAQSAPSRPPVGPQSAPSRPSPESLNSGDGRRPKNSCEGKSWVHERPASPVSVPCFHENKGGARRSRVSWKIWWIIICSLWGVFEFAHVCVLLFQTEILLTPWTIQPSSARPRDFRTGPTSASRRPIDGLRLVMFGGWATLRDFICSKSFSASPHFVARPAGTSTWHAAAGGRERFTGPVQCVSRPSPARRGGHGPPIPHRSTKGPVARRGDACPEGSTVVAHHALSSDDGLPAVDAPR